MATLERANAACNAISQRAWETRTFGQFKLHRLLYRDIRASTGLTAQVVVRCVSKVADAYKLDKRRQRVFRPHDAITYDDRILRWYPNAVSIWTVGGRQRIPFVCDERTCALLASRQGESDLVTRDGLFFLYATVNVEEPPPNEPPEFLGVDLGIVNLATDSDGTIYSGEVVERVRRIAAHRRRNLQRRGTKSAKRKLRRIKRGQSRFQKDVNHTISKRIVASAEGTGRGIALEDLTSIRDRTTVRRTKRARHANWSFSDLRHKITYKATLAGVPVVLVDPRNTSRACSSCGSVDAKNRKTQAEFVCILCGYASPADSNAARNIRARALVSNPNGANQGLNSPGLGTSSRL